MYLLKATISLEPTIWLAILMTTSIVFWFVPRRNKKATVFICLLSVVAYASSSYVETKAVLKGDPIPLINVIAAKILHIIAAINVVYGIIKLFVDEKKTRVKSRPDRDV